jgi:flavin-dependent dehydrogenase
MLGRLICREVLIVGRDPAGAAAAIALAKLGRAAPPCC